VSARNTTRERFGITEKSFELITEAIARRPEIERAVIFGSRAMGNAKHGSDIDLAIYGDSVTRATAESLSREFNERVPIPTESGKAGPPASRMVLRVPGTTAGELPPQKVVQRSLVNQVYLPRALEKRSDIRSGAC
jgi:predicted nucleotidyltransferase